MNYLNALFICKLTKTKFSFSEFRNIRKKKKDVVSFLHAIIPLNKAEVIYDRVRLTDYYLNGGNIENISNGLIIAKKGRITLTLIEAIEMDKKGIIFHEYYKDRFEIKADKN
ncbi:hypothetical protein GCQ56_19070 [Marinifilum sp. N1E240]|uniref:hypothetical protein n=1 Tax=Marinifilum sp. N1E240 TaxID=2608082 RepID=UPI00128E4CAD|nr:hypothetical protein [Marinifilum sp. N1E240]MPQ49106.1 hypothetical protein [Marinifilum sp. N1E240]